MATPRTTAEFVELMRRSGIVDDRALESHLKSAPDDPGKFAGILVRDGVLTHFQAEMFLLGKWRRFTIGPYKVLERLGNGHMYAVYLVQDLHSSRLAAAKVLPTVTATDPMIVERFHQELHALPLLDHPNIVRSLKTAADDSLHYFVMEYFPGNNLVQEVERTGPVASVRACDLMRQAADGLRHAHGARVVHRAIKPSNLLVSTAAHRQTPAVETLDSFPHVPEDIVKICDFGVTCWRCRDDAYRGFPVPSGPLGLADFIAPEQAADWQAADQRSDLYSLGCTFYYLLTGLPPFDGRTLEEKLRKHEKAEPLPVESANTRVTAPLARIIRKLMEKRPDDRYQSAGELIDDLDKS